MSLTDRIARSFRALVREMMSPDATDDPPTWALWVAWEYQVANVTETSFDGRATSSRCPFPDLRNIPLLPGIAGTGIKPALNSLVCVAFINGDPTRPRVVHWDQTVPQSVALAMGTKGVVRVDDLGQGGTFTAAAGPLLYTGEDGLTWQVTGAVAGAIVNFTATPVTALSTKVITKATNGSTIVKAGG